MEEGLPIFHLCCPLSVSLHWHRSSAAHSDTGAVAVGCVCVGRWSPSVLRLFTDKHFFLGAFLTFLCSGAASFVHIYPAGWVLVLDFH